MSSEKELNVEQAISQIAEAICPLGYTWEELDIKVKRTWKDESVTTLAISAATPCDTSKISIVICVSGDSKKKLEGISNSLHRLRH